MKSKRFRWTATILLVIATTPGSALASDDWPRFLGRNSNGVSSETNLLERWSTHGPTVLWERTVGPGYSAPSIRGNLLVLHHRLGDDEVVEAMNPLTGATEWTRREACAFRDPYGYNNGPRSTPCLTSNRCYTFGAAGKLSCLNLPDGRLVWQRETAKDWSVPEAFFGVGSSPLLEGDRLIVMVGGQPNSGVVALDPETGRTIWASVGSNTWHGVNTVTWRATKPYQWTGQEKIASYSSPVAATIHGHRHLFCLTRQGLVSLNPTNGAVRFARWFQSSVNESVNAMTPVVSGDLVLISAAYYRIGAVLLRVKPDGQSFEEVWRSPANAFERDPRTGNYPEPALTMHWSNPILADGFLYGFSGRNEPDATLRCVEFETGKLMWSRDEGWPPRSSPQPRVYGRGSLILADGKLIALGEGGKLGLFRPNPRRPEELCAWQLPSLHHPCWVAPVLSRSHLYLRSEDRLVCVSLVKQ